MTMKRALWEALVVVVAGLAIFGVWKWGEVATERALTEQAEENAVTVDRLERSALDWTGRLAEDQAEAVFRAFAAGIQPAVLAGSQDALLVSKQQLLYLPNLAFVHLLKPDGAVIFSSDEKMTLAGRAGERARWALSAPELMRRPGEREGTLELAAPIKGLTETEAILWMSYDTSALADATRPESGEAATPEASDA